MELASPPTLAEFQRAIHGHQGSTTPGATGLTYNMAKGWPDQVTHYVHQCLLHLWNQPQTPGWLQWSWLCPKPKNPEEEVTLDGLRPLLLLEVIRKLWTGIIVGRITRAWERHRILATAQQGFRPGRGTDTALIQFINAREHAEETRTPLYTSSWDIRRAFDSVSREAMELGWMRLGVPPQIAGWLAGMDVGGATAIRSPWALQTWWQHQYEGFATTPSLDGPHTFQRERGTPQGDVTSPHNWTSFFDIALRALELDAGDPTSPAHILASATRPAGHRVSELAYADDLVSMAHTRAGLQRKADIISAFTTLFDMEISVGKLRLAVFGPTPPTATDLAQSDTLLIHGAGWTPETVHLRRTGTIKMLGVLFDISGPQVSQIAATKLRLQRVCNILMAQRAVDNAALTATISTLTRAAYTAQFSPWPAQDLTDLDIPLNKLYRRISSNMPSFPNALLYLPASVGGLGFPRLSTYTNARKWSIAQRAITSGNDAAEAAGELLQRAARYSGNGPNYGTNALIGPFSTIPSWGGSLGLHATTPHPVALQQGLCYSPHSSTLACSIPLNKGKQTLRLLRARGLHTWGDLTMLDEQGHRHWLPQPLLESLVPMLPQPEAPCHTGLHPPYKPGQFWILQGTSTAPGGIYQLRRLPQGTPTTQAQEVTMEKWIGHGRRRSLGRIPIIGQTLIATGHVLTLPTTDFCTRGFRRLLIHQHKAGHRGTVLAVIPDTPVGPPPPPTPWMAELQDSLPTTNKYRVYVDGSWRPATPPVAEDYFGIGGTHEGGGSIIITQEHADWRSRPILVIPFHTPRLPPELGGLPSIMELLAITGGLEILGTLGLTGTIHSDCQGIIRKLLHPHVLRRNTTGPGYPLLRYCVRTLQQHPIQLCWTRSHPERSTTPPHCWDQHQWGIYLADRFGGPHPSTNGLDFPTLQRFSPISHQTIAEGAISPQDWVWSAMGPAPLLGSLPRTLHLPPSTPTRITVTHHEPYGKPHRNGRRSLPTTGPRPGNSPSRGSPPVPGRSATSGTSGGTRKTEQ